MRTLGLILACAVAAGPVTGSAQERNLVPFFSHGPTIAAMKLTRDRAAADPNDWQVELLTAGAGYGFNFHVFCKQGCETSWLTLAINAYASYDSTNENVNISPALSVGTFNNLFSLGIGYALFDQRKGVPDKGLLIGEFDKTLWFWSVNFGFSFGGGKPPAEAAPGAAALPRKPPVGFVPM